MCTYSILAHKQVHTHIHTTAEYAKPMLHPHAHVQNSHLNIKLGRRNEQIPNSVDLHIFPSFQRLKKARVHSYGTHWKVWTHNSRVWAHLINKDFCHRFSIRAVSQHPLSKADKITFVLEELNVWSQTDTMMELWPPACWEQAITMTPHEPLLVCGGSVEGVLTTTTGFTNVAVLRYWVFTNGIGPTDFRSDVVVITCNTAFLIMYIQRSFVTVKTVLTM